MHVRASLSEKSEKNVDGRKDQKLKGKIKAEEKGPIMHIRIKFVIFLAIDFLFQSKMVVSVLGFRSDR